MGKSFLILCLLVVVLPMLCRAQSANTNNPSDYELKAVATILVAEAGIDGEKGMMAVAEVIRNRAQIKNKKPIEIIKQRGAFSSLRGKTIDGLIQKHSHYPQIRVALEIAYELLTSPRSIANTTNNATHFDMITRHPWWCKYTTVTTTIGHHRFYQGPF